MPSPIGDEEKDLAMKPRCEFCQHGFLATLSHELRNPLAALSNSVFVLAKCPPGDVRAARALLLMDRQIRHMSSLLDNLTEAASLGRGGMKLHASDLDLAGLVRNACQDLAHLFNARGIELREEIPDGRLPLCADATRLNQVLGNLLQNAAQFTPRGGWVRVMLERDQAALHVRLRVQDTGIGLDPQLRDRLFQPFSQSDTSLARTGGGLGLGLTLVKGIVDLHGGAVWAESPGPGQGSTFVVELPWRERPETLPATGASSA